MDKQATTELAAWLSGKADTIRNIETAAGKALHENNDEQAYRQAMEDKAAVLSSLADDSATIVSELPEEVRGTVSDRLSRFSQSASMALRIGSVFYMSALLYPDNHKQGEPNDLERFVDELRNMAD